MSENKSTTKKETKQLLECLKPYMESCNEPKIPMDFSDDIIGNKSMKELLGKWTNFIYVHVLTSMQKYYDSKDVMNEKGKNDAILSFTNTNQIITYLTPVLEDFVHENIYGIENIFIAVYGIISNEVSIIREFLRLSGKMEEWDCYQMTQKAIPEKLKNILSKNV